eukprot:scaffold103380_cov21-Tisochrysis_lutea.AAC.4
MTEVGPRRNPSSKVCEHAALLEVAMPRLQRQGKHKRAGKSVSNMSGCFEPSVVASQAIPAFLFFGRNWHPGVWEQLPHPLIGHPTTCRWFCVLQHGTWRTTHLWRYGSVDSRG